MAWTRKVSYFLSVGWPGREENRISRVLGDLDAKRLVFLEGLGWPGREKSHTTAEKAETGHGEPRGTESLVPWCRK